MKARALLAVTVAAGAMAAAMITSTATQAAIPYVNNPVLRETVYSAFQPIQNDLNQITSCKGCPGSAVALENDTATGIQSLTNILPSLHSMGAIDAATNAAKALRDFALVGNSMSTAYNDYQQGLVQMANDEVRLAKVQYLQARGPWERAVIALRIPASWG
jgi:hypothetical protein